MKKIQLKLIDERLGRESPLPDYATGGSAGLNIRACVDEPQAIRLGETKLLPSGIALFIDDPGMAAVLLPRSGLGHTGI